MNEHNPYRELNRSVHEAKRIVLAIIACIVIGLITILLCLQATTTEREIIERKNQEMIDLSKKKLSDRGLHKYTTVRVKWNDRLEFEWKGRWYRL